ncbi:molybdopterin-dependent oxidoreductase [Kitasatospora aburaviensis]
MSNDVTTVRARRRPPARVLLARIAYGIAAACAAVAVGEAAAAFVRPQAAPVVAIGSAAIDLAPTPVKEWAVRSFGTSDKTVLLTGIYTTTGLLAAALGPLAARRRAAATVLPAAFGALGAWAALARPDARPTDALPSAAAALAAVAVLLLLLPHRPPPDRPPERARTAAANGHRRPRPHGRPGRRGGRPPGTAGRADRGCGHRAVGRRGLRRAVPVRAPQRRLRRPRRPHPPAPGPPLPPPASPAALPIPGLAPLRTPVGDFYRVDTALTLPRIDPHDWTLRIHGMVDHPVELSFADLLALPLEELDHTLSCVSSEVGGPYVGTTRWLGAPLPALLRRAGVRAGADQLLGRSQDGMTIGTPLECVLDGRTALLAVAMDGAPLPVAHGFPAAAWSPASTATPPPPSGWSTWR